MNEYQDQSVWFEVHAQDPYGEWVQVDESGDWVDANDRKHPGDRIIVRTGGPAPF